MDVTDTFATEFKQVQVNVQTLVDGFSACVQVSHSFVTIQRSRVGARVGKRDGCFVGLLVGTRGRGNNPDGCFVVPLVGKAWEVVVGSVVDTSLYLHLIQKVIKRRLTYFESAVRWGSYLDRR